MKETVKKLYDQVISSLTLTMALATCESTQSQLLARHE